MTTAPLPPAGWYPDPHGFAEQRWWDGQAWTDHIHPAPVIAAAEEAAEVGSSNSPAAESVSVSTATYPLNWSVGKQEKKSREAMKWLLPAENTLYHFSANSTRPLTTDVVVTDIRVFTYSGNKFGREVVNSDITGAEFSGSRIVILSAGESSLKLSSIDPKVRNPAEAAIRSARTCAAPAEALQELERRAAAEAEAEAETEAEAEARAAQWAHSTVLGKVRGKSYRSIARLSQEGEIPWLVIGAGFAYGVLAAFEDRLVIVKTGAATSFMAGSLGGERAATFYFTDITALEYNSGFISGVLEVTTPSYQGSANKDYWRGVTASRNANSDNPFTLSNTLPMTKPDYITWTPQIQQLRAKIAAAKRPAAAAPVVVQTAASLADELGKLAALRDTGVLSDEEFAAAKAQLIVGGIA